MGRKSKANVRKQEILSHFYEVIIEEGFEGASIAKIAKKMDVNPSLLIHYFSTKDAMIIGLIEYIIQTYSSHILPDFSKVEDPRERWEDVVDVLSHLQWDTFLNQTVFYSAYTLSFRSQEIQQKFAELYQKVLARLEEEIIHARDAGIIQVQDASQAARLMLTLMEGANFCRQVRVTNDQETRQHMISATLNHVFSAGKI